MATQQLDLFGTFDAPPAKEKQAEMLPVRKEVEEPIITVAAPSLTEEEKIETPVAATATPDQALVFSDDKIAVKIKPKVAVQMPQPRQILTTTATTVTLRPKSKRGRKSYKEIDAELDLIEIPDEEVLNQKLYYSITEVAKWFKVNASLLRYWENEFDILKPRKNRKGDRLFRPEDIKNLQVIYYLLRNRKFSLEGAKKFLRNNRQQVDMNVQLAQSLTKFRSFLLELKANLGA
jgi:DNA-binding transcriptional MerR regulator